MRSELCKLLDTGDSFPLIEFTTVQAELVSLPKDFEGHWNVFLIYRGHW